MTTKPTTHVLFVTDMSGSMSQLANDVRGGFNTYLSDLRKAKAEHGTRYRLTVTLFEAEFISLCVGAKLADTPDLTTVNYAPRGGTALLDAVGKTVLEFESKVTLADADRALLVIQTDGEENSSREFKWESIRDLLEAREKTGKWTIVYLGQGVNAWSQGQRFGASTQTVDAGYSSSGTRSSYSGLAGATRSLAETGDGKGLGAMVAATPGITDDE
jgi:hypothetical protein